MADLERTNGISKPNPDEEIQWKAEQISSVIYVHMPQGSITSSLSTDTNTKSPRYLILYHPNSIARWLNGILKCLMSSLYRQRPSLL